MTTYQIYDNGGATLDRYTIVFTDENSDDDEEVYYVAAAERPQGFWQHGSSPANKFSVGEDKLVDIGDMTPEFQLALLREFQA